MPSRSRRRAPAPRKSRPDRPAPRSRAVPWVVAAGLAAAAFLAYQPAWHAGLVWDDAQHLTPPALHDAAGLWRIWVEVGATQQYYPLTHSLFWLQHALWGDGTLGYHLVNIGLHAASAGLLWLVLRRLGAAGALLAAAVFALHPVQVESVAWITELKNTLSGMFYFAAALAYLRFDESRRPAVWASAFGLFGLALAAKTVTATLPVALAAAFWWRRGRLRWREDLVPLVPFVAAGVAAGLVTVWVERHAIGAVGPEFDLSLVERTLLAGRAVWFYLGSLAWPAGLTFVYPRWSVDAAVWWQYLFPAALVALVAGFWRIRTWTRAPLAALAAFVVTLAPALGFVNVYPFRFSFVADHFQYHASAWAIALAAAGAARLAARMPARAAAALGLATVALLGALTWRRSHDWADARTLYRATVARNPEAWLAHNNLAAELLKGPSDAEAREARRHAEAALRLQPGYLEARYNLAGASLRLGAFADALAHYDAVLAASGGALGPRTPRIHHAAGRALDGLGRPSEAVARYRLAMASGPPSAAVHVDLGIALGRAGRHEEALASFREASRLAPDAADIRANVGGALLRLGRAEEAASALAEAVRLDPGLDAARLNLALALEALDRHDEAAAEFAALAGRNPRDAAARRGLGRVFHRAGRYERAVREYEAALALEPGLADVHNDLAVALLALGRRTEAIARLEAALRLDPTHAGARANLARIGRSPAR